MPHLLSHHERMMYGDIKLYGGTASPELSQPHCELYWR
jgi:hypothetical protein